MSSYRFVASSSFLSGGVMTGTSAVSSNPIDIRTVSLAAFYISWTGTPNGTFAIEGSVDGTNFSDMGITVTAATGTNGGSRIVDIGPTAVGYVRVTYTNSSGSGTLSVKGSAKSK